MNYKQKQIIDIEKIEKWLIIEDNYKKFIINKIIEIYKKDHYFLDDIFKELKMDFQDIECIDNNFPDYKNYFWVFIEKLPIEDIFSIPIYISYDICKMLNLLDSRDNLNKRLKIWSLVNEIMIRYCIDSNIYLFKYRFQIDDNFEKLRVFTKLCSDFCVKFTYKQYNSYDEYINIINYYEENIQNIKMKD